LPIQLAASIKFTQPPHPTLQTPEQHPLRREDIVSGKIRLATLVVAATMALSGLALAQDGHFYDRDYGYRHYDRDDYGYNRTAFRVARDFGYEDGSWVARRDIAEAKPYNPFPRGGFKHEDHGYRREYSDKYAYREAYARAYREGYERAFRRY
jgi:hypothetical protein